jgi:hypothetical protein
MHKAHELLKSLGQFAWHVAKFWWALIPGLVCTLIGFVQSIRETSSFAVPWSWTIWIWIAGLFISCFLTFHRMRLERDKALQLRSERDKLQVTLGDIAQSLDALPGPNHSQPWTEWDQANTLYQHQQVRAVLVLEGAQEKGLIDLPPLRTKGLLAIGTWKRLYEYGQVEWRGAVLPLLNLGQLVKAADGTEQLVTDREVWASLGRHSAALVRAIINHCLAGAS